MPQTNGVARLIDVVEDGKAYYVVMERAGGCDLYECLSGAPERRLPPHEAREVLKELLTAVAELHAHGFIHKDLKLENVMLNKPGPKCPAHIRRNLATSAGPSVKLIDFDTVEEWNSTSPKSKHVLGTDQYIAPEAYEGKYSPASDIFAVGVIAYKILTGSFPYNGRLFDDKPGENWVGSPKMKEIRQKLCDARRLVLFLNPGLASGPAGRGLRAMAGSEKPFDNLQEPQFTQRGDAGVLECKDRLRNESTTAETEWANATRAVAAARAKDDELRAEVKWRTAERTAAERASNEAESRFQLAKEALAQAEKQCMLAAAAATQKQSALRQLSEFESAMQHQAKLVEQARAEVQQAKSEASSRQLEVESLRQDLSNMRALYEREKMSTQRHAELQKEHEALVQELERLRSQLSAAKASGTELQASLRQAKADHELLAAELGAARAREAGLEGELAAVRRTLSCTKTEASMLRTKLEASPPPSQTPRVPAGNVEIERGTGMASRCAPSEQWGTSRGTDRVKSQEEMKLLPPREIYPARLVEKKPIEVVFEVQHPQLSAKPLTCPIAEKPESSGAAVSLSEGFKRKVSEDLKAEVVFDDFPDTQEDQEEPEVKCPRLTKPGPTAAISCTPESAGFPQLRQLPPKALPSPVPRAVTPASGAGQLLEQPKPSIAALEHIDPALRALSTPGTAKVAGNGAITPGTSEVNTHLLSALQFQAGAPQLQPGLPGPSATQPHNSSVTAKAATSGRRCKRSKEEVLRMARSMYSVKPSAKQLRNPPLKLYPAHVDYVLTNWERYPTAQSARQLEAAQAKAVPRSVPSSLPTSRMAPSTNLGLTPERAAPTTPTSWQHVQHFLQAQVQSARSSYPSGLVSPGSKTKTTNRVSFSHAVFEKEPGAQRLVSRMLAALPSAFG
ncbi:spk1 [Symbiodinium pilosum]|uniref:Spk1 protein n=1 Tax=Symbiodinium pilosum TaxID=2952 RepID=A0A812QI52_SYMPI|nr:spk1 [Symbiodinium pilosum]